MYQAHRIEEWERKGKTVDENGSKTDLSLLCQFLSFGLLHKTTVKVPVLFTSEFFCISDIHLITQCLVARYYFLQDYELEYIVKCNACTNVKT